MTVTSAIQVNSGGMFDPLKPDPAGILIEDIGHSLSAQSRFLGHGDSIYSVAEHCVHVSRACDSEDALWGLLHDGTEAYLGDMPSPLKRSKIGKEYVIAESRLMAAICERFGLIAWQPASVSRADKAMLEREHQRLFSKMTPESTEVWESWREELPDMDESLLPDYCEPQFWPAPIAKVLFLERFMELGGQR